MVISDETTPDLTGFDAVQMFGLVRPQEAWLQARNAKRQGKGVVLATVYCEFWEFERRARRGLPGWIARHTSRNVIEALKAGGRGVVSREWSRGSAALFTRGYERMQRDIIGMTDLFLPNSQSEWQRVVADFGAAADDSAVQVVPNGVDTDYFRPDAIDGEPPEHLAAFEGCVLCVARIEGRKNQLQLVEALDGTGLQLVLAGKPAPNQPGYVAEVRRRAGDGVHVLGPVSEDEKRWLYKLARVHALPSWMETTGLSSLEAAAMGCSLAVSPAGDTRDYFGEDATYCDPADAESIRTAVPDAYGRPPSDALASRIRDEYNWNRTADVTYAAYRRRFG